MTDEKPKPTRKARGKRKSYNEKITAGNSGEATRPSLEYELDSLEGDVKSGPILITLDSQSVFRVKPIHGMNCSSSDDEFDVRPEMTV